MEVECPSSDSMSDSSDLDDDEGVTRMRKFLADCERDTRREG